MKTYILEVYHKERPKDKPFAYLLVEIKEKYEHSPDGDKCVTKANIDIYYQKINLYSSSSSGRKDFSGCYSKADNAVSLISSKVFKEGAIFVDPPDLRGQRIGTYLLNSIVNWVKQWPEASVDTIKLVEGYASPENKERRNWLYEQFNIAFDYDDDSKKAGTSRAMYVDKLTPVDTWKENILEYDISDFLSKMLREKQDLSSELKSVQRENEILTAEIVEARSSPFFWAVRTFFQKFMW